eukprot:12333628-Ditylum_brightwellii.AAC.1
MMTIPFQTGFASRRRIKAIAIMLKKDPGDPKIQRLRIIAIVEGDMNAVLKKGTKRFKCPTSKNNHNGHNATI